MKAAIVKHKNVVVTGCSSGIGEATAYVLKEAGWNVLPTARTPDDMERLRDEGFEPIHLDVAHTESIQKAVEKIMRLFGGKVGGLVNNAGYGQPGAVEDLSRDTMRRQFEVNLFGMQELTNRFIPVFRQQGWGRVVNISSVVGRLSLPFFGIYSASKFAMEALSDAMRVELRGSGVGMILVEPGPIESSFRDRAIHQAGELDFDQSPFGNVYAQELTGEKIVKKDQRMFMLPPKAVGEKVLLALESGHPKTRYKVTWPTYVGAFMRRFAPDGVIDYLMWNRWKQRAKRD